ncbi:hypothetical protein ACWDUX_02730 [Streptomyces sp. NPDC003444]
MAVLERLRSDHAPALLVFERENRAYFAASVPDRGVREVCRLAREEYGLSRLTAVTTLDNAGSRAVLGRVGFGAVGSVVLDGRAGAAYELDLAYGAG